MQMNLALLAQSGIFVQTNSLSRIIKRNLSTIQQPFIAGLSYLGLNKPQCMRTIFYCGFYTYVYIHRCETYNKFIFQLNEIQIKYKVHNIITTQVKNNYGYSNTTVRANKPCGLLSKQQFCLHRETWIVDSSQLNYSYIITISGCLSVNQMITNLCGFPRKYSYTIF